MASVHSPTDAVQASNPVSDSAKSLDPSSPASGSPGDDEEPALPEGFGKSFAVRDGDRQGVYIYVPTEGLTEQQILILEAEVVRAATTQAQRNKELQLDAQDLGEPRKEQSDPLPTSPGSVPGWDQLNRRLPGAPLGKPEHTPRRRGRRGGVKQHLYQQMHAQQRSLRNASAMHQNFMAPHYDGLPQAALNSAGLMAGGTGVFLPAQQASRRRSLPVGGMPPPLPGGYIPGPQPLNYMQGSAPAFNNVGNHLLPTPGAVPPGANLGGHLDPGVGADYLLGQDQAHLMASVSNSPGGNSELVTDALSRMLTSWAPLDMHMASDSISSTASADTIRQMSMEQARNSSLMSSGERPHGLRQLSAHIPPDMSGFWANAANPCNPLDMPR